MSFEFDGALKIMISGSSHGESVGVRIEGFQEGGIVDLAALQEFLNRRRPGGSKYVSARSEQDTVIVLGGLAGGVLTGEPLEAVIKNQDARPEDYKKNSGLLRPGHSDFSSWLKSGSIYDDRASGRMTAPLCIAGGICKQLLEANDIFIGAQLTALGCIAGKAFDPVAVSREDFFAAEKNRLPTISAEACSAMQSEIERASDEGDSVGGVAECAVIGFPAGMGEFMFNSLQSRISSAVFAIPGIKGIEFGFGFSGAAQKGSLNNDPFYVDQGIIKTRTNNAGGILGGVSTGMPIIFRAAIKPTPSISVRQDTVDVESMKNAEVSTFGRHDPCIAVRIVPCLEAAAAIILYDMLLEG